MNTPGDRLRFLIEKNGYSIKDFAKEVGVTPTIIYNVCNGYQDINRVTQRNYRAIANGLGFDSDGLDDFLSQKNAS